MLKRWQLGSLLLVCLASSGMAIAAAPTPGLWQFRVTSYSSALPGGSRTQTQETCVRHPAAWIPPTTGRCTPHIQNQPDASGALVDVVCVMHQGPVTIRLHEKAKEQWAADGASMTVTGATHEQFSGIPVAPVLATFSAVGTRVGPCH